MKGLVCHVGSCWLVLLCGPQRPHQTPCCPRGLLPSNPPPPPLLIRGLHLAVFREAASLGAGRRSPGPAEAWEGLP